MRGLRRGPDRQPGLVAPGRAGAARRRARRAAGQPLAVPLAPRRRSPRSCARPEPCRADGRARRSPTARRAPADRSRGGGPPPHAAAGPAPAGAVHRAGGPARGLRAIATGGGDRGRRGRQDHDQPAHAAPLRRRRLPRVRAADPPDADADMAHHVRPPRRGEGDRRAGGLAAPAAHQRRDPRAGLALRRRRRSDLGADHLRPHAAAARPAPAGGLLGRRAAGELRPRSAAPTPPRGRRRRRARPLPRGVRPGRPARRRRVGRGRPARLRRRLRAPGDRLVPRRARHGVVRPSRPPAAAGRHAAPAPLPRPLGPAAAGLRPARPHHPARAPAAEADAQRRPDRDGRRPRRRELEDRGRAHHDHAAHRDRPRRAQADPRGGGAHGALLRAGRDPPRSGLGRAGAPRASRARWR